MRMQRGTREVMAASEGEDLNSLRSRSVRATREAWDAIVKREILVKLEVKRICVGSRLSPAKRTANLKLILETCLMSVSGHKETMCPKGSHRRGGIASLLSRNRKSRTRPFVGHDSESERLCYCSQNHLQSLAICPRDLMAIYWCG